MKLLILTLEEKETIQLRRDDTNHYRTYGDPSVYMLPPSIILGEDGNYDERIEIPRAFTLEKGKMGSNAYSSYMPIREMDRIHEIQEALGLERMDTGLFTSLGDNGNPYSTELEEIRVKNLEIVELDGNTARTIRRRPLKRY